MSLTRKHLHPAAADDPAHRLPDFDALFEQHWEPLCRMLYNILGDWDEAEDAALGAFVKLYQKPPADSAQPAGWLYRVASNLGLNALRSRIRRARYEALAPREEDDDPAQLAQRRLEQAQVREALASLKPAAAQILILRHSGLSYAEIADALGIPQSSVGTQLSRAEKAFEARYRERQPEEDLT